MELSGDGLPESIFLTYVSIIARMTTLEYLNSCGRGKKEVCFDHSESPQVIGQETSLKTPAEAGVLARPKVKAAVGQVISSSSGKMLSWNICTSEGNRNQYGNTWVRGK